jgi:hypothetical protein
MLMIDLFYPLFFFTLFLLAVCVGAVALLGIVLWWSEEDGA